MLVCVLNGVTPLQLGGVQLDKDLRVLVGYLSSLTQWPIRDKFAKLVQMSTILGLDTVSLLHIHRLWFSLSVISVIDRLPLTGRCCEAEICAILLHDINRKFQFQA